MQTKQSNVEIQRDDLLKTKNKKKINAITNDRFFLSPSPLYFLSPISD